MENYSFNNQECLRDFEICPRCDSVICLWFGEIGYSIMDSDL